MEEERRTRFGDRARVTTVCSAQSGRKLGLRLIVSLGEEAWACVTGNLREGGVNRDRELAPAIVGLGTEAGCYEIILSCPVLHGDGSAAGLTLLP